MVSLAQLSRRLSMNSQLVLGVILGMGLPYEGVGSGYIISEDTARQAESKIRGFKPVRGSNRSKAKRRVSASLPDRD